MYETQKNLTQHSKPVALCDKDVVHLSFVRGPNLLYAHSTITVSGYFLGVEQLKAGGSAGSAAHLTRVMPRVPYLVENGMGDSFWHLFNVMNTVHTRFT